jgi:hypothetical protein
MLFRRLPSELGCGDASLPGLTSFVGYPTTVVAISVCIDITVGVFVVIISGVCSGMTCKGVVIDGLSKPVAVSSIMTKGASVKDRATTFGVRVGSSSSNPVAVDS